MIERLPRRCRRLRLVATPIAGALTLSRVGRHFDEKFRRDIITGMSQPSTITGDQLTSALHVLNVKFIFGGDSNDASLHKKPTRLIAALAESGEARLRLALIPLFLQHPEFARHVRSAAKQLKAPARLTLQCYYTAAVFLAQIHQLSVRLPDYFSQDLQLETTQYPKANLRALAGQHHQLSGEAVNWLGTYQHAAKVWMRALEIQHV